ncbi:hypothetical protein [Spirillospora sp. NPDC047279]|uniref:hypothetical protein n=1 Tax=Spirillospora sp. NPDC047279 TaxID=3155478 RepID=UPI0033E9B816
MTAEAVQAAARHMAAMHADAPRRLRAHEGGSRDALLARWRAGFDQVLPFHGEVVDAAEVTEIQLLALRFLAGREALFDARIAMGRLVADGAGVVDGVDDAARLATGLERLNASALAERFVGWYSEYADDPAPPSLRHHYVAFHAFDQVRAACLRVRRGDPVAAAEARVLTGVALRHLRAGTVSMVLVGGVPDGSRSRLAGALAERLGSPLLSSPGGSHAHDLWAANGVYASLLDQARQYVRLGETVVMDASWAVPSHREEAAAIAAFERADLVTMRCGHENAERNGHDDGVRTAYLHAVGASRPWPGETVVDTGGPSHVALDRALGLVRPFGVADVWRHRTRTTSISRMNGHAAGGTSDAAGRGPARRRRPSRRPPGGGLNAQERLE